MHKDWEGLPSFACLLGAIIVCALAATWLLS